MNYNPIRILARWLVSATVLMVAAYLIPGIRFANFYAALVAVLVLGLINALIRPLIIILTLPINLFTLGLFTLVINAFMFWLASSVVKGFFVTGFLSAFWGALAVWLINWTINYLFRK
ncbi:MAG TPA: phage holin family protein [Candidatus Udaeobacter sp.]|nr:phage holin family protein [Candidatus Udaeobacter sp.]